MKSAGLVQNKEWYNYHVDIIANIELICAHCLNPLIFSIRIPGFPDYALIKSQSILSQEVISRAQEMA